MNRSSGDFYHLQSAPFGNVAVFHEAAIQRMTALLPAQSKEVVTEVLGISSNTWLKIKRGEPIRASIACGLANRLARLPQIETDQGSRRRPIRETSLTVRGR